ncbi:LacI family DNA-binding transcriptional regulator [Clostridium sp. 19966]|uniref:LacI family DNA-binding transcriptional regulator n=1 Tax=Clostridium sp. 19966 TaxID=2768166 RepID=UPI0028DECFBF|nr:LacI family DNA-binding transcriptional regulator [Clostridium sp. 19966]MDT8717079.1 LacI family DNA-binding transcriptional regulator [Clostridium sp. 19966]
MAATIKDVAKEANVSPSTVSRVLTNNPKISDETKERVYKAVEKLKYYPNAMARSLAHNSTKILGLILPSAAEDFHKNLFFIELMTGIGVAAKEREYNIMYSFGRNEKDELSCIKKFTNSKLVDGVILLTSRSNDKCIKYLKSIDYPFVVVGRPEEVKDVIWVDNDNFEAMYSVTSTFIEKGFKNIAFIGGPEGLNVSIDRMDGFTRSMKAHCMEIKKELVVSSEEFEEKAGYEAMMKILDKDIPDAVITADDLIAIGAMKAIKEKNIEDKIAVVGFNNIPIAVYQNPPLSSVEINTYDLGYNASKLLLDRLKEENYSKYNHFIVKTTLIERESSNL